MTPRQSRSSGCGCEAQPRALCMQPRAAEAGRSWTVTRAVAAPTATLPAMPCCHDRCTATPTAPIPAAANSCLALRPQIAHRSWRAGTHACSGGARARSAVARGPKASGPAATARPPPPVFQVHAAFEDNFWSTKMNLQGCSSEALAKTKNDYDVRRPLSRAAACITHALVSRGWGGR